MSDCLAYWKYYWDDVQKYIYGYGPQLITYHWHTHDERFFSKVNPGDNLWVITSGGPDYPDEWRLLEKLTIEKLDKDPNHKYGEFHALADRSQSEFYSLDDQEDLTPIIHSLRFQSGKKIPGNICGRKIGNYLQSLRPLSLSDIAALLDYSKTVARVKDGIFDR